MLLVCFVFSAFNTPQHTQIKTPPNRDPYSLGSYSYHPVGSDGLDDRAALAEPVSPVLFFAGEATDSSWPSTVHGAYQSGQAAAAKAAAANPQAGGVGT